MVHVASNVEEVFLPRGDHATVLHHSLADDHVKDQQHTNGAATSKDVKVKYFKYLHDLFYSLLFVCVTEQRLPFGVSSIVRMVLVRRADSLIVESLCVNSIISILAFGFSIIIFVAASY